MGCKLSKIHLISSVFAAALGFTACIPAQAADWKQVIQIGKDAREIDPASIAGTLPIYTYVTRHVFGDLDEYRIGKRNIKYLVISSKADCRHRTTARLTVDAYDESMSLVSKQTLPHQEEIAVSPESIEEAVLNYVCKSR